MASLPEKLAQNPLFGGLQAKQLAEVAQLAIGREYQKGELFALYGEVWPYLFLVETGLVHAMKESSEGRSLLVRTVKPGEFFWGLAFFRAEARMPVTLEAYAATRLYLWHRESLQPFLLAHSQVLWELCGLMIERMERASQIVENLAFHPVAERLAGFLLDRFGPASDVPVARDLTLDEMAARIGTTREVVCRILHRFSDEGLIQITRTEFALSDRTGLARLSGRADPPA